MEHEAMSTGTPTGRLTAPPFLGTPTCIINQSFHSALLLLFSFLLFFLLLTSLFLLPLLFLFILTSRAPGGRMMPVFQPTLVGLREIGRFTPVRLRGSERLKGVS